MDNVFVQISFLLAITVGTAFIVRFLHQPLIIAYIFAGIVCGPLFFNFLHEGGEIYKIFAQFGVVLLLFIIGLNLNFRHLQAIGKISFIAGLGQLLFTGSIGFILLLAINIKLTAALYLAMAITFSSTIVIMKLLSGKNDTDTTYGKYTIGLMLVQDIIAVILVIVLGFMREGTSGGWDEVVMIMVKFLLAFGVLYLSSKYFLPTLLNKIADSSELLFLFTLAWCFGVASFLYLLGFSLEIGAVLSGIALSSSPYQLEIVSRTRPLRDFFLVLFFIVLGSEMSFSSIKNALMPAIMLVFFIIIGNPLILYLVFRCLKFTRRNSFLAGLTAAQVSEFGFVLLSIGRQAGYVGSNELTIFTIVAITTIFVSAYLITYSEYVYRLMLPFFYLFGPDKYRQVEKTKNKYKVWVVGYHRIGMKVAEALGALGTKFCVIDFDPTVADKLKENKIPFFFGDVADIEFLENLAMVNSKIIIMTIPSVDDQINLIKFVRKINNKVLIIGNAYHKIDANILYEYGANLVIMPHVIGGQWIAKILKDKKLTAKRIIQLKLEQDNMVEG